MERKLGYKWSDTKIYNNNSVYNYAFLYSLQNCVEPVCFSFLAKLEEVSVFQLMLKGYFTQK